MVSSSLDFPWLWLSPTQCKSSDIDTDYSFGDFDTIRLKSSFGPDNNWYDEQLESTKSIYDTRSIVISCWLDVASINHSKFGYMNNCGS